MNELILKEVNDEWVIYQYLPEGRGEPGRIVLYRDSGEAEVAMRASEDNYGDYGHKATNAVKRCMNEKNLPLKFIQAWY